MTQRTKAVEILAVYFEKNGGIMSADEYRRATDTPIRFARVKSIFGSWNRMENIVRTFNGRNQRDDSFVPTTDIDDVIRQAAEAQHAYAEKMRAASENVDAKTAREEAARLHLEADKLRAATPEGALENKMRKGGVTDQDAKAKLEAIQHAVAEEHALLAQTPAGAALGKALLGGVEDNEEKTVAIAEQNAQRETTALLAATPEGAAVAKLSENDVDGQLTREAQARIRNELRPFVPPVTANDVAKAEKDAVALVRDEVREVVKVAAADENVSTGSATKAEEARVEAGIKYDVELSDDLLETIPPADRPVSDEFADENLINDTPEKRPATSPHVKPAVKAPAKTPAPKKAEVNVKEPNSTPAKPNTKEAAKDN